MKIRSGYKLLLTFLMLTLTLLSSSCFTLQNISQNKKTTQSYSSENIFLNPVLLGKKKVYFNFRNSTTYENFNVSQEITALFEKKGFAVSDEISERNLSAPPIMIQVNLRYYGIFERDLLNAMLEDKTKKDALSENRTFEDFSNVKKRSKYDVDFSGLAIGGIVGFMAFHTVYAAVLGGALFGAGAVFFEHFYESKIVIALLDVQISEKGDNPIVITDFRQTSQGSGGTRKEELSTTSSYQNYQTRIVVISKNKSLNDEDGVADTRKQIISVIGGLL